MPTPHIHTIRVFVDTHNNYGSPLGIVVDESHSLSIEDRQRIATRLNYSETVFIDDVQSGHIQVFSPIRECPFSMYAALGAGWYINTILKTPSTSLSTNGETIHFSVQNNQITVSSKSSILPQWNIKEVETVRDIEQHAAQKYFNEPHTMIWAWQDKQSGLVRARTFASDWGIPEDEANGSGSMRLAMQLKRSVTVIHGKGSVLHAAPGDKDMSTLTGSCALDQSVHAHIKNILSSAKTIAIVGLSDKQDRPSYAVAHYLQNAGYTIIPVNPTLDSWNGLPVYPSLSLIPKKIHVDVVDIFRKPEFVLSIVNEAIVRADVHTIWMQEGVSHEAARKQAEKNGLSVFENTCIMKSHIKLNEN